MKNKLLAFAVLLSALIVFPSSNVNAACSSDSYKGTYSSGLWVKFTDNTRAQQLIFSGQASNILSIDQNGNGLLFTTDIYFACSKPVLTVQSSGSRGLFISGYYNHLGTQSIINRALDLANKLNNWIASNPIVVSTSTTVPLAYYCLKPGGIGLNLNWKHSMNVNWGDPIHRTTPFTGVTLMTLSEWSMKSDIEKNTFNMKEVAIKPIPDQGCSILNQVLVLPTSTTVPSLTTTTTTTTTTTVAPIITATTVASTTTTSTTVAPTTTTTTIAPTTDETVAPTAATTVVPTTDETVASTTTTTTTTILPPTTTTSISPLPNYYCFKHSNVGKTFKWKNSRDVNWSKSKYLVSPAPDTVVMTLSTWLSRSNQEKLGLSIYGVALVGILPVGGCSTLDEELVWPPTIPTISIVATSPYVVMPGNSDLYRSYSFSVPRSKGNCYGCISSITGRPKTNYVRGYSRSNGRSVRGYWRS